MDSLENQVFLSEFARAKEIMIGTNDRAYDQQRGPFLTRYQDHIRQYTPDEVNRIITSGSLSEKQKLSYDYFNKDGYYKEVINYYSSLLKYSWLLIPNVSAGNSITAKHISKKYYQAVNYIGRMHLPIFASNCVEKALIYGSYYGARIKVDKDSFVIIDLPTQYCYSRFKDVRGNDVVEFDLRYFSTIKDEASRKEALRAYPKYISQQYSLYSQNKLKSSIIRLPMDIGVCFQFLDGIPPFLHMIPSIMDYDEAVAVERDRDIEQTHKILVQKIPHLNDGRLLFEPEEAAEIHDASVGMMSQNKNVKVLTTYCDVDAVSDKPSAEAANTTLGRIEQNIYARAGISAELFATTQSSALKYSNQFYLAFIMTFVNKIGLFVETIINEFFGNSNISFNFSFLSISYQNEQQYIDNSFKLASSGFSLLLPAIAQGFTQNDIVNIKVLENELLELGEKLVPLKSAYNSSQKGQSPAQNDSGRPAMEAEDKQQTTLQKEASSDTAQGGTK